MSFLLQGSEPHLLLLIDSCCHNYLQPTKSEWLNQKEKRSLFTVFPLISFQDSSHNICHRNFRPSEGCSLFPLRGMVTMKVRGRLLNSLTLKMPRVCFEPVAPVGNEVRLQTQMIFLFPWLKSPSVWELAAVQTSYMEASSICSLPQGHTIPFQTQHKLYGKCWALSSE